MRLILIGAFLIVSCAPSPQDIFGNGIDCKAEITIPEERDEPVIVDVKIFGCTQVNRF